MVPAEMPRSNTRPSSRRASARLGGNRPSRPTTSVRKPGVSSSTAETSTIRPSTSSGPGIPPCDRRVCTRRHAASPSRFASHEPSSAESTTSANVVPNPSRSPTVMSRSVSTTGTVRNSSSSRPNMGSFQSGICASYGRSRAARRLAPGRACLLFMLALAVAPSAAGAERERASPRRARAPSGRTCGASACGARPTWPPAPS